jgi:hypothetical protein
MKYFRPLTLVAERWSCKLVQFQQWASSKNQKSILINNKKMARNFIFCFYDIGIENGKNKTRS